MVTFARSVDVAAPPRAVYEHLMDPHSYIGLSPLVVAVRDVEPGVSYVAVERFAAGPFHWDNAIHVTLTGVPERSVVSSVVSPGRVRLTATVTLTPRAAGGTTVTEEIALRAPRLLRRFAAGQARKVQVHRLAELARRMAG